jgi:transposase
LTHTQFDGHNPLVYNKTKQKEWRKMAKHYSEEFKVEAIRMVLEGKKSQNQVASELGLSGTTLSGWVCKYKSNPGRGIAGSQTLTEAEIELRKLKKKYRDLEEENEILKKAAAYFAKNQK